MENQNIQWANWGEQPQENKEQPQVNWGEQPQVEPPQLNWGEQPQEEQPQVEPSQLNWGEQPQEEQNQTIPPTTNTTDDLPQFDPEGILLEPVPKDYSILGRISRISIDTDLFHLNSNLEGVLENLNNLNLTPLDSDGRYDFSPEKDTDLGKAIGTIVSVAHAQNLKISNCFVYKNKPTESSLNVFKGKPKKHFIYFIQGDYNSGDVVLDLSSLGGPSVKTLDSSPNILTIFPGWVPFSISKNTSNKDFIALIGTLN